MNDSGADNYVLGPEIARGGMGYILEAEDTKLKRTVAAKLMVFEGGDDGIKRRFLREAEVLARLAHPNIVPIHDIVWEDGVPLFYTMKRVKGRTLQSILNDLRAEDAAAMRDFTLDRLLLAFRKVCDAVAFAHSMGIIHRDLKPNNVMIGEFGEVLVMDWGLAMIADSVERIAESAVLSAIDNPQFTIVGTVVGTPQYMSPEQARGEVDSLDERSDVFSLGGILYAIATLHPPVEGKSVAEVLDRVRAGSVTPPTSYSSSHSNVRSQKADPVLDARKITPLPHVSGGRVPAALSSVVMKALRLEKTKRYADVASLAADVEAFQGGFATKAEEAGTFTQLRLLMLRHKAVSALLATMLALSVFFVLKLLASESKATQNAIIATANEQRAVAHEKETQRALVTSQLAVAEAAFRNADASGMVATLDSVPQEFRDQRWEYLSAKRDASLGVFDIPGIVGGSAVVAIPHRAGQFVVANEFGIVGVVDARSRAVLWRVETKVVGHAAIAVSDDGLRVAVTAADAPSIKVFRIADGALESTLPSPCPAKVSLAFSPDARRLVVTDIKEPVVGRDESTIFLLNVEDGSVRWKTPGRFGYIFFSPDGARIFLGFSPMRKFVVLDAETGAALRVAEDYILCMAKNPSGTRLALGLYNGEVVLIDTATGAETKRAKLHRGSTLALAWTAADHLLSIGNEGGIESTRNVMRLWETKSLSSRAIFLGLPESGVSGNTMFRLALCPESGLMLVKGHPVTPYQLWRIPVDLEVARVPGSSEQGWSTAFLSDTIVLGRSAYALARYDVTEPRKPKLLPPAFMPAFVASAVHRPTGLIAIGRRLGGLPCDVRLCTIEDGKWVEKHTLTIPDVTFAIDFDPSARRVLATTEKGLFVFDVATGELVVRLDVPCERAVFLADSGHIAAIVQKKRKGAETLDELTIFEIPSGKVVKMMPSRMRLNALAISPDRTRLAIGGDEQVVRILDAATLQERTNFRAHDLGITSIAFHPTRAAIATASSDDSVKLWNLENSALERTFLGFDATPVMVAFSPSGHLLSVESQEEMWRLFELGADRAGGKGK